MRVHKVPHSLEKVFFFSCSDPQIIMSMLKIHLEANNINSAIQVIISNAPIET